VMFFADPVAAFNNLRSALRAGGRLGFVCWRAPAENPMLTLPLTAALPWLPTAPEAPPPGAPGPFAFAEAERVREILERAGFVDIAVERRDVAVVVGGEDGLDGAVVMALAIGPLPRALAGLGEEVRAPVTAAVRVALARHEGPDGVTLPAAVWLVTARRGDE
jgi:hypothetical protein